jgi:hypothetical protein
MKKKVASKKSKSAKKSLNGKHVIKSGFPRAEGNPFRENSSYSVVYDILAKHKEGLPRQRLVELLAKTTGKNPKRAGFDAAVLLSAKDSVNGPRHRSCRSGFYVERENDFVKLRTA